MGTLNHFKSQFMAAIQYRFGALLFHSGIAGWHKQLHAFAMKQLQRASHKQHPEAQQLMAALLSYRGENILDKRAGVALLEQQAQAGDTQSQFLLAEALLNTDVIAPSHMARVVQLYAIAAEKGHAMAALRLSKAYAEGKLGLEKDEQKAQYWSQQFMQHSQNTSSIS